MMPFLRRVLPGPLKRRLLGAPPRGPERIESGVRVSRIPVLKGLRRRCRRHRSRSTLGTVWDGDGASRPLRLGVLACGAVDRLAAQRLAAFGRVDAAVAVEVAAGEVLVGLGHEL